MLHIFSLILALSAFAAAPKAPFDMQKYLRGLADPKKDCETRLGGLFRNKIADDIDLPDEAYLHQEISMDEDYSRLRTIIAQSQNGGYAGPGVPLHRAGFWLDMDESTSRLHLFRNKISIYSWHLVEPIAEVRYISDSILNRADKKVGSGFLSIIGWTQTKYYRLDGSNVRKIDLAEYEEAVNEHFPAILNPPPDDIRPDLLHQRLSMDDRQNLSVIFGERGRSGYSITPASWQILAEAGFLVAKQDFYNNSGYRERLMSKFYRLPLRVPSYLPIDDQLERSVDLIRLSRMEPVRPGSSVLKTAIGELAEAIFEAVHQLPTQPIRRLEVGMYPTLLLRYAAKALREEDGLREQFAQSFSENANGMLMKSVGSDERDPDSWVGFEVFRPDGTIVAIRLAYEPLKDPHYISVMTYLRARAE